jgi:hypothetical protein
LGEFSLPLEIFVEKNLGKTFKLKKKICYFTHKFIQVPKEQSTPWVLPYLKIKKKFVVFTPP